MMDEVTYSSWLNRSKGGQYVGISTGVKGEHPSGIVICVNTHRSQFKNKKLVDELMEYALSEV